ncbi:hypothetical protein LWE61_16670 [Sphingobium sufflavum]|uniref:hypothetical protein n=1 Tax=Sphingobium sufflavum TaxID=1129547 RepID=UPI001F37CEC5|nr:hypothetical protein [Sphingobium sufflavum]MCE7798176.1 hypothetical protein [Sphingobium sufflavum]
MELSVSVDKHKNRLTVVGRGLWSLKYVTDHFREFEAALFKARSAQRASTTLVDLREAAVQSPEVAAYVHGKIVEIYCPPERAVLVVNSQLVKMQMGRGLDPATHAVFLTLEEAEGWLNSLER